MHKHDVVSNLCSAGFVCLGGFRAGPDDRIPDLGDGVPAASLVLVGNAGPAMWREFGATEHDAPMTLDDWTRARIDPIAARLGARALYPFDGPPYHPFQRWAWRTGAVFPSPLKVAIHPVYGLWHGFRAALLFADPVEGLEADTSVSPCESCLDRPCLGGCPVGAFDGTDYNVMACRAHVASPQGAACLDGGCLARHACPVGQDYAYEPAQARFHMAAFVAAVT